jgi:hypothetical protein
MKEVEFKPEAFGTDFEGSITIRVPKTRERMQYIKECNFKLNQAGEMDTADNDGMFEKIAKMIEIAERHVVKVDFKHIATGTEYKSFEDIETDSGCDAIVSEVAQKVLRGFGVSKN